MCLGRPRIIPKKVHAKSIKCTKAMYGITKNNNCNEKNATFQNTRQFTFGDMAMSLLNYFKVHVFIFQTQIIDNRF